MFHFGGFQQGCIALYSFINILFVPIPVMQINRSCISLTSLLVPTLFQKPFLWEQQIRVT
jgi:hypothetical protein